MIQLTKAFLKIFFRNYRALFFVLVMPAAIYLILSYLGIDNVIRFNGTKSYEQYLLPGILALSLMQLALFNTGYALIEMRRSGTLKRLRVTPLPAPGFLLANTLARFVMGLMQAAVLLLCGMVLFGLRLNPGMLLLPALIFAALWLFLNFGYIIAALARDYEDAAPATAVINLVFMFLGDIFFPSALLPRYLTAAADALPMKPLSALFRFALTQNAPTLGGAQILVLAIWLLATTAIGFWVFSKKAYR